MAKIALIGAGSVAFSMKLTIDILCYPEFQDATFTYMDIDKERLDVAVATCRKAAKGVGADKLKIKKTMDMEAAVKGADYVIGMVNIGGFPATLVDFEAARQFGLDLCVGDTTGPTGIFRCLRTYPVMHKLTKLMEKHCPNALLLNYSNPMSMLMNTVLSHSSIQGVGLCHSIQGCFAHICGAIGEKPEDVNFTAGGINHMAFYLRFEKDGKDLYPRLRKAIKNKDVYNKTPLRYDIMNRFGYYVTEGDQHASEYSQYYLQHKDLHKHYNLEPDHYLYRCQVNLERFEMQKEAAKNNKPLNIKQSHEYAALIMHGKETGANEVIYGNVQNDGSYISNIDTCANVEIPILVDRNGFRPVHLGKLPAQCAAYVAPHVAMQELVNKGIDTGERDYIYQACMLDPHTSAQLPLDKIWQLTDLLFESHKKYIPKIDKVVRVAQNTKKMKGLNGDKLLDQWTKDREADSNYTPIEKWKLIGPFPFPKGAKQHGQGLSIEGPVEKDIGKDGSMTFKNYKIGNDTLKWSTVKGFGKYAKVNLNDAVGPADYANAYAYAEVTYDQDEETAIAVGSDDGAKIWVNGQLVHDHEIERGCNPEEDIVNVTLRGGKNRILIKISQNTAGWAFCASVMRAVL